MSADVLALPPEVVDRGEFEILPIETDFWRFYRLI